ncbi:MAG: ArsI/CadI family heavy metal resistance metalloenzyme [Myxococcota bacterium]
MTVQSAVQFPTPTRVHVALAVKDAPRAVAFYRALFGQEPTKERSEYAKFEVFDPPLNLALNETPTASTPPAPQHFGIQVQQPEAITAIADRMKAAGFLGEVEEQVTCCYAVQDKIWMTDPDGHRWELFIVTEADSPVHSKSRQVDDACCAPIASTKGAPKAQAEPEVKAEPEVAEEPCCAPSCCS